MSFMVFAVLYFVRLQKFLWVESHARPTNVVSCMGLVDLGNLVCVALMDAADCGDYLAHRMHVVCGCHMYVVSIWFRCVLDTIGWTMHICSYSHQFGWIMQIEVGECHGVSGCCHEVGVIYQEPGVCCIVVYYVESFSRSRKVLSDCVSLSYLHNQCVVKAQYKRALDTLFDAAQSQSYHALLYGLGWRILRGHFSC
jgi:hypothetical protein